MIKEEKVEESLATNPNPYEDFSVREINESMTVITDPEQFVEKGCAWDDLTYRDGPDIIKKIGGDSNVLFKELMTQEQWERYGDRSPNGFIKKAILDIGKNSIVWLASNRFTGEKVALR